MCELNDLPMAELEFLGGVVESPTPAGQAETNDGQEESLEESGELSNLPVNDQQAYDDNIDNIIVGVSLLFLLFFRCADARVEHM